MDLTLLAHIVAGAVSLVAGFVALFAAKGAPLHRRAGRAFVVAMLAMTGLGTVLAAARGAAPAINIPAAVLTAYLVVTALATVRRPAAGARHLEVGGMVVALGVGLLTLGRGFEAVARGGSLDGMPAFPYFLFGVIGVLSGVGDLRMMRSAGLRGASRITRHLWRMSLALFVAAMSFFVGQSDEFPRALRIMPLLALPGLVVLVTMLVWLWRVRVRPSLRGTARGAAGDRAFGETI